MLQNIFFLSIPNILKLYTEILIQAFRTSHIFHLLHHRSKVCQVHKRASLTQWKVNLMRKYHIQFYVICAQDEREK